MSVLRSAESTDRPSMRFGKCRGHQCLRCDRSCASRGFVDIRATSQQDVDHRREILAAVPAAARGAERLARRRRRSAPAPCAALAASTMSVRSLCARSMVKPGAMSPLSTFAGHAILSWPLVAVVPWMTSSVFSSVEAEALRQRDRFGVELARDDRQVVVHQLGAHAGADAAAVMDRRAHRLEQRLDAREGVGVGADHEERLAALGVAGQPADRRVDERRCLCAAAAAASRSVTSGSIVLMSTITLPGRPVREQAVRPADDLLDGRRVVGSMVKTMSLAAATAATSRRRARPSASSARTGSGLTSKTTRREPLRHRFDAMGRPMLPSPMKPMSPRLHPACGYATFTRT